MIAWEGSIALMFGFVIFKLIREKKKLIKRNEELENKVLNVRTDDLTNEESVNAFVKDNADKDFEKRLKELEDKYEASLRENKILWEKKEAELRALYLEDAKAEQEEWKNTEQEQ